MDQRAGEKEERNSEDSSDHRRKDDVDAAAEGPGMNNHGESMDHQRNGGYEEAEEETAGVLKEVKVVLVGASEEEASAPLLVHPCSLLQLLLRACAGCLDSDHDDPKPAGCRRRRRSCCSGRGLAAGRRSGGRRRQGG
jgi:hypothetical protein